jgi:hypothetical protein
LKAALSTVTGKVDGNPYVLVLFCDKQNRSKKFWNFIIKMEEATGGFRKLLYVKVHDLFSPNIIRIIRLRTGQIYSCGDP